MIINVLVTGASGFIGKHFIKNSDEFNIIELDLIEKSITETDLKGIDTVVHLAAHVHQMKGNHDEEYYIVNRDLAFDVALLAKKCGVKQFIYISTIKVYGESTLLGLPWNETSPCSPSDHYSKSKYQAEKLVLKLEDKDFKVVLIRPPLVYGEGVKANMLSFIKLVDRWPIIPLGGINNRRSFVYVGNLVAMMKKIINFKASGIFIPSDSNPLSTTSLITLIAKSLNKKRKLFKFPGLIIPVLKVLKPSIISRLFESLEVENSISNDRLSFHPPFTTKTGFQKMINWYLKVKEN
ncbi:MAG: NAD-dependent epimerase/dehydratase family protein [Bacteroidales bacterium]|nr:NAD-dependent epimerase/dehydratase family protein [Bacteroidales bacterium]